MNICIYYFSFIISVCEYWWQIHFIRLWQLRWLCSYINYSSLGSSTLWATNNCAMYIHVQCSPPVISWLFHTFHQTRSFYLTASIDRYSLIVSIIVILYILDHTCPLLPLCSRHPNTGMTYLRNYMYMYKAKCPRTTR